MSWVKILGYVLGIIIVLILGLMSFSSYQLSKKTGMPFIKAFSIVTEMVIKDPVAMYCATIGRC